MNLQTAIEINTKLGRTLAPTMAARGTDAIKLGIEALKRLERDRLLKRIYHDLAPLPGETKE